MKEGIRIEDISIEKKRSINDWIKEHKTELIIAGVTFATIAGALIFYKNRDEIEAWFKVLTEKITESKKLKLKAEPVNIIKFPSDYVLPIEKRTKIIPFETSTPKEQLINVSLYLRNLPKGHHVSPQKLAEAERLGIELPPGKTIVDPFSYTKNSRVA